jgi:hypothetical protein
MRAMSPVTVDYPHSLTHDTVPLTSSAGTAGMGRPLSPLDNKIGGYQLQQQQQARNVAIEDPYSNEQVMFSMMDVSSPKQQQQQQTRYASPTSPSIRHDIPMRGIGGNGRTMSPQQRRYAEEDDYLDHQQTASPSKIRRPSWERRDDMGSPYLQQQPSSPQPQHPGQPAGEQMVRDWLWQSPDRRNA